MTSLLSARNVDEVRPFAGARVSSAAVANPLEAECVALRNQLDEAVTMIADARRDGEQAAAAAREEGRREGHAQAEAREAERLAALDEALQRATEILDRKLTGLDRLAAELASAALMRLLDDPDRARVSSASFIARQVQDLRRARIIRAHVNASDFGDEGSLAALIVRLRETGTDIQLVRDPALGEGQARLDLAFGHADLDLAGQWQSLAALLRDMARE